MSTFPATPAASRLACATSACLGLYSHVTTLPSAGSARASQMVL
jgi:hypothetical protein